MKKFKIWEQEVQSKINDFAKLNTDKVPVQLVTLHVCRLG